MEECAPKVVSIMMHNGRRWNLPAYPVEACESYSQLAKSLSDAREVARAARCTASCSASRGSYSAKESKRNVLKNHVYLKANLDRT